MSDKAERLSANKCLQHARMLVPKFSFEHERAWHIHWPKDQPYVVHAATEKELVHNLATWLQDLGRVANKGKHIEPDYP